MKSPIFSVFIPALRMCTGALALADISSSASRHTHSRCDQPRNKTPSLRMAFFLSQGQKQFSNIAFCDINFSLFPFAASPLSAALCSSKNFQIFLDESAASIHRACKYLKTRTRKRRRRQKWRSEQKAVSNFVFTQPIFIEKDGARQTWTK